VSNVDHLWTHDPNPSVHPRMLAAAIARGELVAEPQLDAGGRIIAIVLRPATSPADPRLAQPVGARVVNGR